MSESVDAIVSPVQLAELADLFDRSEFAFDPLSEECREATAKFEDLLRDIYEHTVKTKFPAITLNQFRCGIRKRCREFIRKNS